MACIKIESTIELLRDLADLRQQLATVTAERDKLLAEKESAEPFGYWHQGDSEDESDFYLHSESGDVSCPYCVKLYTHPFTKPEGWDDLVRWVKRRHGLNIPEGHAQAILDMDELLKASQSPKTVI